jgi:hypothetical protein
MVNRTALLVGSLLLAGPAARSAAQSSASAVAGFDARAEKHRGGVYFTGDDIRKRSPARLSDLFRGLSGITLATSDGKVVLTSSRGARTTLDGTSMRSGVAASTSPQPSEPMTLPPVSGVRCPVAIGLDGQMMDPSFSIDDLPVSAVHGVEMYTGSARVPVEFGAGNNTGCGVVMVWSKTGSDKP